MERARFGAIGIDISSYFQRSSLAKEGTGKMCHHKRLQLCQVCYA